MSFYGQSLQSTKDLPLKGVFDLFKVAGKIKSNYLKNKGFFLPEKQELLKDKVVAFAFFEPSTRTSLSFQMACHRLQIKYIQLPSGKDSSLVKGEDLVDTIMNINAMSPDLLVVRSGQSVELETYLNSLSVPVVIAGSGVAGHPTQALLDVFSMQEHLGDIKKQKIVFVGDVLHSRVAASNFDLLSQMGAEIAVCGPEYMLPKNGKWQKAKQFNDLNLALEWATVCMGLRVQTERHSAGDKFSEADYAKNYCITNDRLKFLRESAVVMHPGPFVRDLDFSKEVLADSRCIVEEQVANGVYIRAALMAGILIKGDLL